MVPRNVTFQKLFLTLRFKIREHNIKNKRERERERERERREEEEGEEKLVLLE